MSKEDYTTLHGQTMTMARLFRNVALRHPNCVAVVADGATITYAELDARTDRIAETLRKRGVTKNSTIATLMLDCLPMVEMLIVTAKLGATVLTMNWRLAASELAYILSDGDPMLCVASQSFADLARQACGERPHIVIPDHDPDGLLTAFAVAADAPRLDPEFPVAPTDRWFMLYTSGTTGKPKGCQHSQLGYYMNSLGLMSWFGMQYTDRMLISQPLFHVGGLHLCLATLAGGGRVVIQPRHLDIGAALRFSAEHGVTIQSLPVFGEKEFLELYRKEKPALKLRTVLAGGGMKPPEHLIEVRDTLKVDMVLGYGQSEQGGFSIYQSLRDQLERPTACGKIMSPLEARIVDDDEKPMPDGKPGELLVRGPTLMMGYLNLPEATEATLRGGWLRTGDFFWRDADGFLHFAGRKKEMIKTAGENVYPAEVEKVINVHPAVKDSCVVGVKDKRFGEAVKAFIVLNPGQKLSPADVAELCRKSIAGYKRPRYVEFVAEIPRNFQGKPQRAELSARPVDASQSTDAVSA